MFTALNWAVDGVVGPYAVSVALAAALGRRWGKRRSLAVEAAVVAILASAGNLSSLNAFVDFCVPSYSVLVVAVAVLPTKRCRGEEYRQEEEEQEDEQDEEEDEGVPETTGTVVAKKPSFAGTWKMQPFEQYAQYLEALRIGPIMRRALVRVPIHNVISQRGARLEVTLKTVMSVTSKYVIDGPATKSQIRTDKFHDTATWDGDVLVVTKHNLTKGVTITVRRELEHGGHQFTASTLVSSAQRPDASFVQTFVRVPDAASSSSSSSSSSKGGTKSRV